MYESKKRLVREDFIVRKRRLKEEYKKQLLFIEREERTFLNNKELSQKDWDNIKKELEEKDIYNIKCSHVFILAAPCSGKSYIVKTSGRNDFYDLDELYKYPRGEWWKDEERIRSVCIEVKEKLRYIAENNTTQMIIFGAPPYPIRDWIIKTFTTVYVKIAPNKFERNIKSRISGGSSHEREQLIKWSEAMDKDLEKSENLCHRMTRFPNDTEYKLLLKIAELVLHCKPSMVYRHTNKKYKFPKRVPFLEKLPIKMTVRIEDYTPMTQDAKKLFYTIDFKTFLHPQWRNIIQAGNIRYTYTYDTQELEIRSYSTDEPSLIGWVGRIPLLV